MKDKLLFSLINFIRCIVSMIVSYDWHDFIVSCEALIRDGEEQAPEATLQQRILLSNMCAMGKLMWDIKYLADRQKFVQTIPKKPLN